MSGISERGQGPLSGWGKEGTRYLKETRNKPGRFTGRVSQAFMGTGRQDNCLAAGRDRGGRKEQGPL